MISDKELFPIVCPRCGEEFQEQVGSLRSKSRVTCPDCGINICYYPAEFERVLEEIDRVRSDFIRNVRLGE